MSTRRCSGFPSLTECLHHDLTPRLTHGCTITIESLVTLSIPASKERRLFFVGPPCYLDWNIDVWRSWSTVLTHVFVASRTNRRSETYSWSKTLALALSGTSSLIPLIFHQRFTPISIFSTYKRDDVCPDIFSVQPQRTKAPVLSVKHRCSTSNLPSSPCLPSWSLRLPPQRIWRLEKLYVFILNSSVDD